MGFGRVLGFLKGGVYKSPQDRAPLTKPEPRYVRRRAWAELDATLRLSLTPEGAFLVSASNNIPAMHWHPTHKDLLADDWVQA